MVVHRTLDGAVRQLVMRTHDVADAMEGQIEISASLHREAGEAYRNAQEDVARRTADGTLLSGEVLAGWREFVGTGELLTSVEDKVSRIRDRFVDGMTGKRNRPTEIADAVETSLANLLIEHAEATAELVSRRWGASVSGRSLLDADATLDRASAGFRVKAERMVHDWRQGVVELVRTQGADKRMTAKFLAFGVNGIAATLMVVMIARDDVTAGGGSAAVGRKLLDAIFGAEAATGLVDRAHTDLELRSVALLDTELQRFLGVLESPDSLKRHQSALRESARRGEYARHADFLNGDPTS
jgi:hypothetical protein